jgi:hypothetical protein
MKKIRTMINGRSGRMRFQPQSSLITAPYIVVCVDFITDVQSKEVHHQNNKEIEQNT